MGKIPPDASSWPRPWLSATKSHRGPDSACLEVQWDTRLRGPFIFDQDPLSLLSDFHKARFPHMSLTLPSQSRAASTPSITVNALTTLFTPPPECATQWIAFSRGDIYAPKETYIQRIVEETYIDVSSCYPTSTISRDELYRSYRSLIYSPGICPSGFTTAHSIYSSDNGSMRATCCAEYVLFPVHLTRVSDTHIRANHPQRIYSQHSQWRTISRLLHRAILYL